MGLVTNRHLVDAAFYDFANEGTVVKSIKLQLWQSSQLLLEHTITDPTPLYHDDPLIDVAVVPVVSKPDAPMKIFGTFYGDLQKFVTEADQHTMMFNHALSWDYLLECERLWPHLEPGEFVTFPGYPIWYDRLQTRPVLRSGVIASDPQTDYRFGEDDPDKYDSGHQVLFDAFSTKGNSGSPVYVSQRGMAPIDIPVSNTPFQTKLAFTNYHRSFLMGINASHYNDLNSPRPNDHAGLSRMHKLSVIMDILRANEAPPDPLARQVSVLIPVPDGAKLKIKADSSSRDESIMVLRQAGKSLRAIAAEVGCSPSTVSRVIKNIH